MKEYRYTGTLPSPQVLEQFPNWTHALDEEDEPDQDETTWKPDQQQDVIAITTVATAAFAQLPNGTVRTAVLCAAMALNEGEVEFLYVLDGDTSWQVEVYGDSWGPSEFVETVQYGDTAIFPLKVTSRLPLTTGSYVELTLLPNGRIE